MEDANLFLPLVNFSVTKSTHVRDGVTPKVSNYLFLTSAKVQEPGKTYTQSNTALFVLPPCQVRDPL